MHVISFWCENNNYNNNNNNNNNIIYLITIIYTAADADGPDGVVKNTLHA